jgi:hypothetical protein
MKGSAVGAILVSLAVVLASSGCGGSTRAGGTRAGISTPGSSVLHPRACDIRCRCTVHLSEMKARVGVVALASLVLVAAGGSSHRLTAPLRQRIAAVARRTAHSLDDSSPSTAARVYGPASYRAALKASDGATTTNRRQGRFYVIVLHGRFVCAWCPRPPGAHSPIATRIWSATGHGGGFGIRSKLPASLSQLGRPTLISLR